MKHRIISLMIFEVLVSSAIMVCGASDTNTSATHVESLTLDQAFDLADSLQPEIAQARAMIQAAEGRVRQAGAFPNPEVIFGAEQSPFDRDSPNEREYVAGIGQTIPISRRLSKAREAEMLDREVRARGLDVKRREIRKRVHGAFATALYQEKAYQSQSQILLNTDKAVAATRARLDAGDALREDLARVEMELARARVELNRAEASRQQAMLSLTGAIGNPNMTISSLVGTLDTTFDIPALEELADTLESLPENAQAEADVRARKRRLDLARSERIPDIKVEALYHRLESSQANTFDLGISVPLPLFNRNQGRIQEARAEISAAEARSRMTQNELLTRLRESHRQLTAALAASRAIKSEILPRADTVLKAAEARYSAGDISLTDVLPIRREWAAAQLDYLESLRDVMQAWIELKPLTTRN